MSYKKGWEESQYKQEMDGRGTIISKNERRQEFYDLQKLKLRK